MSTILWMLSVHRGGREAIQARNLGIWEGGVEKMEKLKERGQRWVEGQKASTLWQIERPLMPGCQWRAESNNG